MSVFFFKQKTAYEMRISDWSSDVCSSDLIAGWRPEVPPDLIYANASLQWLADHQRLLPELLSFLAPGGTLAVQMPDNHDEPTHSLMRETAREEPWLLRLIGKPATTRVAILPIGAYHDLLSPLASPLTIWRSEEP